MEALNRYVEVLETKIEALESELSLLREKVTPRPISELDRNQEARFILAKRVPNPNIFDDFGGWGEFSVCAVVNRPNEFTLWLPLPEVQEEPNV